jgi:hypothetical protein
MAYFNHAFKKNFICSGLTSETPNKIGGMIATENINTAELTQGLYSAPGTVGLFDKNYNSVTDPSDCCTIIIAGASLKATDKQGPHHGGYRESNKSKLINPKYVSKFYTQDARKGNAAVVVVGDTDPAGLNCTTEFLCGETYDLRIDVKGTSPLRFAHHNLYYTVDAYGGCCADPSNPVAITDPGLIYGQWGQAVVESPYLQDFVMPILTGTDGNGDVYSFYGTEAQAAADGNPGGYLISDYLSGAAGIVFVTAGLQLIGAYEDTVFGDCTFQPSDFYAKNPLQIYASQVDLNGDPCTFSGVCITDVCKGLMNEGLGEAVLRDLIISESYLQNFLATDLRIREITQGNSMVDIIDRSRLYNKAYLLHSIPRFNNPSSTFDNDQYLIEVAFPSVATLSTDDDGSQIGIDGDSAYAFFIKLVTGWLLTCNNECFDIDTKVDYTCVRPRIGAIVPIA